MRSVSLYDKILLKTGKVWLSLDFCFLSKKIEGSKAEEISAFNVILIMNEKLRFFTHYFVCISPALFNFKCNHDKALYPSCFLCIVLMCHDF